MTTLDIAIACGVNPKKVSSSHGGEYASACPVCGGNDRFRVWPEKKDGGAWWCRAEDKGGDAISLLMHAKGMSFKEACAHLGRQMKAKPRARTPQQPRKAAVEFKPRETASPAELWQQKAAEFVEASHAVLLKTPDQLDWLAARGITEETARRFKLGWNAADIWRAKPTWGVEDNGKKLWLPVGLIIPYHADGRIHRVRVRRPEGDPRYYIVPGSGAAPMMICPEQVIPRGVGAWIVVESELDAILIAQDAGDIICVASLGSCFTKPDGSLYDALRRADHIINALDFDAAGLKASPWWAEHFPQAERWPVPRGKDPGDYRKEGGDIRAWIIAGLPYGLRPSPSPQSPPVKGGEVETAKTGIPSPSTGEGRGEGVNVEPDKKAGSPVLEDMKLIGYVIDEARCKCGITHTLIYPKHGQRPQAWCDNCKPKYGVTL